MINPPQLAPISPPLGYPQQLNYLVESVNDFRIEVRGPLVKELTSFGYRVDIDFYITHGLLAKLLTRLGNVRDLMERGYYD